MDPCSQHDPVELPDTVQRPVTAQCAVANLGWGTKGLYPTREWLMLRKPRYFRWRVGKRRRTMGLFKRFVFEQAFNRNIRVVTGEERSEAVQCF